MLLVSTIFAVQIDPEVSHTTYLHTVPYTNLMVALCTLQVAVTWFSAKVSWDELKVPRFVKIGNYACVVGLVLLTTIKQIQHLNALGDLTNNGLWWKVRNPELREIFQIFDYCWLVFALALPMIQSGYLTWRRFHSHVIILRLCDNRRTKIK